MQEMRRMNVNPAAILILPLWSDWSARDPAIANFLIGSTYPNVPDPDRPELTPIPPYPETPILGGLDNISRGLQSFLNGPPRTTDRIILGM